MYLPLAARPRRSHSRIRPTPPTDGRNWIRGEMAGSAEARRVMLRGVERMLTMVDGVSMKIVHSMLVAGDAETLLQFLPVALLRTFNMHPCMRALQVKDEDLTAEIQAP